MTILEGIAERLGAITWDGLPPEAVQWAKAAILDTVGVTLAGSLEECARIVSRVLLSEPGVGGLLIGPSSATVGRGGAALAGQWGAEWEQHGAPNCAQRPTAGNRTPVTCTCLCLGWSGEWVDGR